jgi:hypothetical protein
MFPVPVSVQWLDAPVTANAVSRLYVSHSDDSVMTIGQKDHADILETEWDGNLMSSEMFPPVGGKLGVWEVMVTPWNDFPNPALKVEVFLSMPIPRTQLKSHGFL